MAEIRLSKLTKQFNIGLQTLVDFLNEKGAGVDMNPNAKISDSFLPAIESKFGDEQKLKQDSEKVAIKLKEIIELGSKKKPEEEDQEDTNQFMWPVTIPLILGILVVATVLKSPDGPLAFWTSIIPFTSPIVMMARIPFGVPVWELALSLGLLVLGFIGSTWVAARIYRVGILMYGKKGSYKELWKWIRYKE